MTINNQFNLYLKSLNLKDFATFKSQTIHFQPKFNAIIGETGSGKSLILDAIQLVLGQRADKKFIRKDCDFTVIEATFECHDQRVKNFFVNKGFPFDDEILIKRIIYSNGKSKAYLNHMSCSLSTLSEFSQSFIDLVGQFENQKLLSSLYQLELLDRFGKIDLAEYQKSFKELKSIENELNTLREKELENQRRSDYLLFQINELDEFSPSAQDELNLIEQKNNLLFQQTNASNIENINSLVDGTEEQNGILKMLADIEKLLPADSAYQNSLLTAQEMIQELSFGLNQSTSTDIDNNSLEDIIDRLDNYQKLKSKFKCEAAQLEEYLVNFKNEYDQLKSGEDRILALESKYSLLKEELTQVAINLHNKRTASATDFEKVLTKEIRTLKMVGASIRIEFSQLNELSQTGLSHINIKAETNKGEGFHFIKDIASGGELSRILLAIRKIIANTDSISIFLFDEIDTGIGGETALFVGKALCDVANSSQVLAITHLAQIANYADQLVVVNKNYSSDRTWSEIKEVFKHQIKEEVSQMNPLQ